MFLGLERRFMVCVSVFESVLVVGNSIVYMYSKRGRINKATTMFNVLPVRNLISWNTMIAGYTPAGQGEKALVWFHRMQEDGEIPDEYTLTTMLKACGCLGTIRKGSVIHGFFFYHYWISIFR